MPNKQRCIDTLNELLKGELMAMEIYAKQMISKATNSYGMLDQFARDHKEHAQLLADRIRELGNPVTGTGMAGAGSCVQDQRTEGTGSSAEAAL